MTRQELFQFIQDIGAEAVAKGMIEDAPPSMDELLKSLDDDKELATMVDFFASKLQRI